MGRTSLTTYAPPARLPLFSPLLAPWPMLAVVTDTNALARSACYEAQLGVDSLLYRMSQTGRAPLFVAPHVLEEMHEHLPRIAASMDPPVAFHVAQQAWRDRIAPRVLVVDLPIGEHLRPEIAAIRHPDTGDIDDLPTAALASFLAPAVIVSKDRVFSDLGLGLAGDFVPVAKAVMLMAATEAGWAQGLTGMILAGRMGREALRPLGRIVRVHWLPTALLFGMLGGWLSYVGWRTSWSGVRAGLKQAGAVLQPLIECLIESYMSVLTARAELVVVQDSPWREESLVEACARHLVRRQEALSPSDLRDELNGRFSAAAIKREIGNHPAFVRRTGGVYAVGRPAIEYAISRV